MPLGDLDGFLLVGVVVHAALSVTVSNLMICKGQLCSCGGQTEIQASWSCSSGRASVECLKLQLWVLSAADGFMDRRYASWPMYAATLLSEAPRLHSHFTLILYDHGVRS